MDQLTQRLKHGDMHVLEVPMPSPGKGEVLVRNHYSLISSGTEGSTVRAARLGLLGKARQRPQQVKQVFETFRSQGLIQAYRAVMKKLEAHSPLGYSCAGEVIEVGSGVSAFRPGDLAACGGLGACHAEVVSVPVNLCVKLAPESDLKRAAYNTLGAIALQGVRQADLRLGETCAVIGLGLLGQLTGLLLRASGVRVVGLDLDPAMVALAAGRSVDVGLTRDQAGLESQVLHFSQGLGCDAVIITAAGASLDPINLAGALARQRGTIIVVGDVPTGFDREPHFYRKELQVRMSCSYGPGRYDPSYEEKGQDYPPGYVRWTENRNMQAFQELIQAGRVDPSFLTTHVFRLDEAPKAYDLILSRAEPMAGILIAYDVEKPRTRRPIIITQGADQAGSAPLGIGFIGAGSYAQSHLLPNVPREKGSVLKGVVTASGASARTAADRFGFEFCSTDAQDLFSREDVNAVFIATRHDSHAAYVLSALEASKHVFVEKPLCLTEEDLAAIEAACSRLAEKQGRPPLLMVGYNRRFAPLAAEVRKLFVQGPLAMIYRINAGPIPPDSWIQDPETGGGRIIGEVCHFVDLLNWLGGASPESVFATVLDDPRRLADTVQISLLYKNGSIGAISYLANGDRRLPKERLEVHGHGMSAVLDDFRRLTIYRDGNRSVVKRAAQDKGQKHMVQRFLEAARSGGGPPIELEEIFSTSRVTFQVLESIRIGQQVIL